MMRWLGVARVFASVLCVLLLQVGSAGLAQQPPAAPGPGPIEPGLELQNPTEVSRPEKSREVPIGRREWYQEEKQRAQEIPTRPPGTVQEDPAVRRGGDRPNPQEGN